MNYVVWDLETDSADTNWLQILEVGCIFLDKNFEGLNVITFLEDISFVSKVFGFLPILDFFCLTSKEPNRDIFTLLPSSKFLTTFSKMESTNLIHSFLDIPSSLCVKS